MKKPTVSQGDVKNTWSDNFKGFINYTLSDQDKRDAAAWIVANDVLLLIAAMVDNGYSIKVSGDKVPGRYIASLSTKSGNNAGYILTARAGSVDAAMARVAYLHVVCFDSGDWQDRMNGDVDLW